MFLKLAKEVIAIASAKKESNSKRSAKLPRCCSAFRQSYPPFAVPEWFSGARIINRTTAVARSGTVPATINAGR